MRAIVTGVSPAGIGGAICRRLIADARARGESVELAACAKGERAGFFEFVTSLGGEGVRCIPLVGDLSDPSVPARLVDAAISSLGGLDVVVSNAGITHLGRLAQLELAAWEELFAIHARGGWLLARAAYPALRDARGALVAIGSMLGSVPQAAAGGYAAAKAALISVCQTLAVEWAADGIRVNVVSPGRIRTPLSEHRYQDPESKAKREAVQPLGRIGTPDDIAGIVSFLAGPDASYITGENVTVDGGLVRSSLTQLISRA
jgi:glucose 1-dehydrogenase